MVVGAGEEEQAFLLEPLTRWVSNSKFTFSFPRQRYNFDMEISSYETSTPVVCFIRNDVNFA